MIGETKFDLARCVTKRYPGYVAARLHEHYELVTIDAAQIANRQCSRNNRASYCLYDSCNGAFGASGLERLTSVRLLVVDDDERICSFIANGLKQEGHTVDVAGDGDEALGLLLSRNYDAAVLDIVMPVMDGLTVIQRLRDEGVKTPILILSAKHSVDDRVTGLRAGGDDYMVKPFAFTELIARVQSLVRRATGLSEPTRYQVGDLILDVLKHEARRGDRRLDLQPREFALLLYLMRNANRVVSKTMIMEHVWGYNFDTQTNVVESRISRLRDKVDKGFDTAYIRTVRGVGYAIRAED